MGNPGGRLAVAASGGRSHWSRGGVVADDAPFSAKLSQYAGGDAAPLDRRAVGGLEGDPEAVNLRRIGDIADDRRLRDMVLKGEAREFLELGGEMVREILRERGVDAVLLKDLGVRPAPLQGVC